MEQFKKAKVVLIPTEKYSNIILNHNNKLQYNNTKYIKSYQQLIITSEDKIEKGDWIYWMSQNKIIQCEDNSMYDRQDICRKIIASYPPLEIISKGINPVYEPIPRPTQQFINQYIESYNRGEVITDVLVEYNTFIPNDWLNANKGSHDELKINPDNTITIKPVKDSWDREEMFKLMDDYQDYLFRTNEPVKTFKEWFNQNL